MKNEKGTTLREWTAPRLMRLNQADGTDKHVLGAESVVYGTGWQTRSGGCVTSGMPYASIASAGGGVAVACGPS